MKNLMILTVLVLVLVVFATPAFADWYSGAHDGCAIRGRHWHRAVPVGLADANADKSETETSAQQNIAAVETARVFIEKGLNVASASQVPTFVAKIEIFNREKLKCFDYGRYSYRRQCYLEPEKVVYITIRYKESGVPVAVGEGTDDNIQDAVEEAAEEAAEKIKKITGTGVLDYSVYIEEGS